MSQSTQEIDAMLWMWALNGIQEHMNGIGQSYYIRNLIDAAVQGITSKHLCPRGKNWPDVIPAKRRATASAINEVIAAMNLLLDTLKLRETMLCTADEMKDGPDDT